jgi:hypothetical protein
MSYYSSSLLETNQTGTTPDYAYNPFSSVTRCKGCNKNLTSNNPSTRYQIQKLIQNTVRVPSSIYTMNLGALSVYQKPNSIPKLISLGDTDLLIAPGVNWNQMSDRANPHKQTVVSGNGLTGNSLKRTITRCRPGALSPGGIGVDIKHNSYDRYLARIKGKAPLRRERIPDTFALNEIPFNRAYPVYGGKLFKTSIINNCNCPINDNINIKDDILYEGSVIEEINKVEYKFTVGDEVLSLRNNVLVKAKILSINFQLVTIKFIDNDEIQTVPLNSLKLYIPYKSRTDICQINKCSNTTLPLYYKYSSSEGIIVCTLFNYLQNGKIAIYN